MSSGFEYVQHSKRELPPPVPTHKGPTAAFLPGTFHPINPKNITAGHDQVLLSGWGKFVRLLLVAGSVVSIIIGINLVLDGVYEVGTFSTTQMYQTAKNPLIGMLIGILATALVQSSSTTTTLTVTAVGTGLVSVQVAIPIILGANIGTTITAMLVAFSYMSERREFKKAFSIAAMHLWFNTLVIIFLFTLEQLFHPLQFLSGLIAEEITDHSNGALPTSNFMTMLFDPLINFIGTNGLIGLIDYRNVAAVICIAVGIALILCAVRVMRTQLRVIAAATVTSIMDKVVNPENSPQATALSNLWSFFLGFVFTLLVTASSVTVASMQPVSVAGSVKQKPLLGVILGANVGTTVTAMFATFAVVGAHGAFAIQAALVHVIVNLTGAILVLCIPQLANLIIRLSQKTANLTARSYSATLVVIGAAYILVPSLLLLLYALL